MKRIVLILPAVLLAATAWGQVSLGNLGEEGAGPATARTRVVIRAVRSHVQVAPGQTFQVALDMRVAEGWWYYSRSPGNNGEVAVLPATIEANGGPLKVESIRWPADHPHDAPLAGKSLVNNVYEGRAIAFVTLSVPADAKPGAVVLSFRMGGQVCDKNSCLSLDFPEPYFVAAKVTVGPQPLADPAWDSEIAAAFAKAPPAAPGQGLQAGGADLSLWAGLGLALLAGVILNIMPCVLPVIPLKVLNLVEHARKSRILMITHGLAFAAGIMLFFAVLAGGNVILHAAHRGIEWGTQFQDPTLRLTVAMVVVAVAANLLGLFNVTLPGFRSGSVGGEPAKVGHLSSVGSGILTAVLSTPCSFGYLTYALAWAQLQPLWVGTAVLLTIGLGMAAPYAILSAFPGLLSKLPRPGRWMELLKQSTGFVMILVALWLISTLGGKGAAYPLWVTGFAVVLAFGLWMWGTWVRYDAPLGQRLVIRGLAIAIVAAAGWLMLTPPVPLAVKFVEFDRERIDEAGKAGRVVVVDFTASWCLTCKWVERQVYNDQEVADELKALKVLPVEGDISDKGLPANEMLYKELREPGVPVSVVFPPGGGEPIRLHGLFSKAELLKAVRQAAGRENAQVAP
jgi:thiol:disulfide interchange protein DsbD